MAIQITKKIVLPTPTEFLRYIASALLSNQKDQRDTTTTVAPRVSRALALVNRQGLIIATDQRETGNG